MKYILFALLFLIGNFNASKLFAQGSNDTTYRISNGDLYRYSVVTQNDAVLIQDTVILKDCRLTEKELDSLVQHKTIHVTKKERTITSRQWFIVHYIDSTYQYSLHSTHAEKEFIAPTKSGIKPRWIPIIVPTASILILIEVFYRIRRSRKKKIGKNLDSFNEPE